MKKLPVLISMWVVFAAITAFGESVEDLQLDYQVRSTAACARLNETLQRQGAIIASKMISDGDSAGARAVLDQVRDTAKGLHVQEPNSAIVTLLSQYELARKKALKPLQDSIIRRLDVLLQSAQGKQIEVVRKVAEFREMLSNPALSMTVPTATTSQPGTPEKKETPSPVPPSEPEPGSEAEKKSWTSLEKLFVNKTWYSGVGVEYIFYEDKTGVRSAGKSNTTPMSWKIVPGRIIEAKGQMLVDGPQVTWYIKFLNEEDALSSRVGPHRLTDPMTTRKPSKN